MGHLTRFFRRLLNVIRSGRAEARLEREIAAHLLLLEDEHRQRGLSVDEARRSARLALGGVEQTKELHRDARSFLWLDDLRRDLRHAGWLLRRIPLFTLTAALSLAVGIGATTTIFTVARALLLQPPAGVVEPRRVVDIGSSRMRSGFGPSSYPNYLDIRQRTTTVDGVYAYSRFPQAMSLGVVGTAAGIGSVFGSVVTVNYFTVLGAVPAAGRLLSTADGERDVIGRTLEGEYPEQNRGVGLRLMASSPVPGQGGPMVAFLALLMVIVSFVLIVACANVAGVLLARAAARRQEMALRLAIGAGRARLVRQLLTETVLLFVLGGTAGLSLARAMTSLLLSLLPTLPFPVDLSLSLDARVIAFAAAVSLVAALASGLAPALHASKANVLPGLRNDAGLVGRLRLRHVFVISQVALSIVLIVGSGLFMRALQRAASIDPGFDSHDVELASVDLAQAGYTKTTGPRFAPAP